jgi:hypothetical protein
VVNKGACDAPIGYGQIWREANRFKGDQYIEALRQHLLSKKLSNRIIEVL